MQRIKLLVLLWAGILFANSLAVAQSSNERWRQKDKAGDKYFVKHDFDRALVCYKEALQTVGDPKGQSQMNLKLARIYVMLQQHPKSIAYYEPLVKQMDSILAVSDVCNYLDALRRIGDDRQAEIVARKYAFIAEYRNNQRYKNTMSALSTQRHYLTRNDSEYEVESLFVNTGDPEFWIGRYEGEIFYASSKSPFHDPHKLFYHRSKYFPLTRNPDEMDPQSLERRRNRGFVDYIPIDLQNGPLAFNESSDMMVVTALTYNNKGVVTNPGEETRFYQTQLLYSEKDPKRKGWSAFKPLFSDRKGRPLPQNYSDAHPFFFNGNRSLLFVSDRNGGYGGMDIYATHWDASTRTWSAPQNLGPAINTEGDEIFPMIQREKLIFSSNGHEGYGGYDLYTIGFADGAIIGNIQHLPYPVNTPFNDLMMFSVTPHGGYLISDRNNRMDDIFTYTMRPSSSSEETRYGVSEKMAIANGIHEAVSVLNEYENYARSQVIDVIPEAIAVSSSTTLTVYFDFNNSILNGEAVAKLNDFITMGDWGDNVRFRLEGYADEMGTLFYNQELSMKRAQAVADYLLKGGMTTPMVLTGKGSTTLTPQERSEEMNRVGKMLFKTNSEVNRTNVPNSLEYLKEINRRARRVDIIIIEKEQ